MSTLGNVFKILDEKGIAYKRSEHEPVKTSEEAATMRGVALKTGVKALVLKISEGAFIMVLVPADKKADLKKIAALEKTKKVSLASPEEVLQETGCEVGGVPPFGHTKNNKPNAIKTYLSKEIFENPVVNFNAGDKCVSVSMKSADLKKFLDAIEF